MSQLVPLEGKHSTQNAHCALVQQKRISSRFGAVLPCTALDFVKGMIWKLSAKPFSGPSQNLTFTFRFCSRTTLKTNWNFLHKLSAS